MASGFNRKRAEGRDESDRPKKNLQLKFESSILLIPFLMFSCDAIFPNWLFQKCLCLLYAGSISRLFKSYMLSGESTSEFLQTWKRDLIKSTMQSFIGNKFSSPFPKVVPE